MMEQRIDPIRLANQAKTLEGSSKLADFARLSLVLVDTAGEVDYCLEFAKDEQGRAVVNGRISAKVMLECQRCGHAVEAALDLNPHLMVVVSDDQAKQVPRAYEPLIVDGAPLTLVDVLEEEILLALPMVPRHAEGECPVKLPEYLN